MREDLEKSVEYFKEAIERDPDYALAYVGLAEAYAVLADWGFSPPRETYAVAKATAEKALEIDNTIAEAHATVAVAEVNISWNWMEAEKEFKRAIELNPNYATAHQWYAEHLTKLGRFDEAIAEIRRAQELDPLSLIINAMAGSIYFYARQYDNAIKYSRETLELDSSFPLAQTIIQMSYDIMGNYQKAVEEYKRLLIISGVSAELVADYERASKASDQDGAIQ